MEKSTEIEKAKVKHELKKVRRELSGGAGHLGESLKMRQRFQSSIRRQAGQWLLGGLIAGIGLALVLPSRRRRSPPVVVEKKSSTASSLFLSLIGIASKQIIAKSLPLISHYFQRPDQTNTNTETSPNETQN